ncbi:MAG: STAS domain-containing protein [Spirochaetes bacterium]|jgi:anti-anti-sigma factor|nr:STAS domain-containing protein [Spirochaetota bacterium]HPA72721.1 STAS domain-containing protein [Spirochaetota bacterium]
MEYSHRYDNGVLVIDIDDSREPLSELDILDFTREVHSLNTGSKSQVVLNLNKKTYFNSSDLGALIKARDRLFDEGVELLLLNPSENILELLKIVGLKDFFGIHNG